MFHAVERDASSQNAGIRAEHAPPQSIADRDDGRGAWFGVGLGNSVQKLSYLPEAHTDFVFAIWSEEFGLIGALAVLTLFAIVVVSMFRIGRRAEKVGQFFSAFVVYGAALMLSAQIFINIGVNIGLLPTKGLTLPFLSYGGSSLIVCLILVALALRVDGETSGRYKDV